MEFPSRACKNILESYLLINMEDKKMEIEKSIIIRKCTVNDVDSIYDIQNIVIDNFKEEEKGYFLPFKKETYLRIVNDPK